MKQKLLMTLIVEYLKKRCLPIELTLMILKQLFCFFLFIHGLFFLGCTPQKETSGNMGIPFSLTIEYLDSPLGIDVQKPRFSWKINDQRRNIKQIAYEIQVSTLQSRMVWLTNKISSSQQHNVRYSGLPLVPNTRYTWRVRFWNQRDEPSEWSETAWFETGMMSSDNWNANWIYDGRSLPKKDENFYKNFPNPLFRKQFEIRKKISYARLYISGLGYYESYLNDKKVGDHVLDPGWTNYDREVLYSTYDVTDQLQEGNNVIGVTLGNGWYNPLPLRLFGRFNLREFLTIGHPRLIAELHISYEDGSKDTIVTNESWKTSNGAILRSNVYLGEIVDARLIKEGWASPGFNDSKWANATIAKAPKGKMLQQLTPAIKITKKIAAAKITEPEPNVYVVDFGQNLAGWIRAKLSGEKGQRLTFRYGEMLYENGLVNGMTTVAGQLKEVWNMKGGPGAPPTAYQEDIVILSGEGQEQFQQKFNFHGFRYVEIRGYDKKPNLEDIVALRLNSDVQQTGTFECSNELFNKIQKITDWTFKSNIFSVQSDCPGREKFGYGADIVTSAEAFMFNYWMPNFYEKTVRDFANDQRPNGGMPETAPYNGIDNKGFGEGSGPIGWQLAFPFIQDQLYKFYGDQQIIADQYPATLRMMDHLQEAAGEDHFIEFGIGDHESISPKFEALTSTAFYYHHAKLTARFAKILKRDEDAAKFSTLSNKIKEAFTERFYNDLNGQYGEKLTEANQIFALYYDLIPKNEQKKVLKLLLKDIHQNQKGHLSTGIFGTKMLFDVLREYDEGESSFAIVNTKEYPGFGYMLSNNATTLWETWEYQDQNSLNHPMFGSVSEWFYRSVLGINQTDSSVAFSEIHIQPRNTKQLEWAKGSYETIYGSIKVDWKKTDNRFIMAVSIPANTEAVIAIPIHSAKSTFSESDDYIWQEENHITGNKSVKFIRKEAHYVYFKIGSGDYSFSENWTTANNQHKD